MAALPLKPPSFEASHARVRRTKRAPRLSRREPPRRDPHSHPGTVSEAAPPPAAGSGAGSAPAPAAARIPQGPRRGGGDTGGRGAGGQSCGTGASIPRRSNEPQLAPSTRPDADSPRHHRSSSAAPSSAPVTATEARNLGGAAPSLPPRLPPAPPALLLRTPCKPNHSRERTLSVSLPPLCCRYPAHKSDLTLEEKEEDPTGPRSPPPRSCPWWPLGPPAGAQRRAPAAHHVLLSSGPARPGSALLAPPSRLSHRAAPSRPSAGTSSQPLSVRPPPQRRSAGRSRQRIAAAGSRQRG